MGASVRVLDFTGVKDRGNFNPRRKPEGDYYAHIVAVDDHESKQGNDGWVFTITIDGDSRAAYPYYCQAEAKQLWKIRELFISSGTAVPKKRLKIDPNKLVGKAIAVALEDDEYEGRLKSVIGGVMPLDELTGARNEPGTGKASKATEADEDDDYEDDEDEDDTPPPPKKKKTAKAKARKQPEPEEDDEDDEEDDTPPPPKKRKGKKAAPPPEDDDDDEDEEDDEPEPPKRKPAKKSKKRPADDEDEDLDLDDL